MIGENLQTAFVQLASEEGVEMDPWNELEPWEQKVWNLLAQRAVHLREDTANRMKEMTKATGTDIHTLANAVITFHYWTRFKSDDDPTSLRDPHQAMRNDDVANWLKKERDRQKKAAGRYGNLDIYYALDHLLGDYRLHADAGQPLFVEVTDYPGAPDGA